MRTKLSGCLLGVVAMAALAVTGAPAAQAAPSVASQPGAHTAIISVPVGKNSATMTMDGAVVTVVRPAHSSATVLTCSVTAGKPFHDTTGVSAQVLASCNTTAATLSFGTALYYNGSNVAQNNPIVHNCSSCIVTVTAPYQSGQWKSGAILGYFDSSGNGQFTAQVYSASVTL